MVKPETKKLLEEMATTRYGIAMREFLNEKHKDIVDVTTVESFEEALGRKVAIKIIKEVFSFLEPKKVDDKPRNQYL